MEFPQIYPFWVNGQSGSDLAETMNLISQHCFETLQYDTAQ